MAYPSTLRRLVIALNGVSGPEYFQAGDALMKPAMVVMFDDADEVKICTSTGLPIGIVGCDADHDLGTVYALGERIPIWTLGCGVDLYVLVGNGSADTTFTFERGSVLESPSDTTQVGHARMKSTYVAVTTDTADATGRGYTTLFWIGKALEAGTVSTDTNLLYVPVKLSF